MYRCIMVCTVALIIGGCAGSGMDLAQCRTADWRAIGFEDGKQGRSAAALGHHRKDCAAHGVTPDFAAYRHGHEIGIGEFCRPQNGYRLGTRGYRYKGVCPAHLENAFLSAHSSGLGLHKRRLAVKRIQRQIRRKHSRSQKIERLMAEKTATLVQTQTTASRRMTLGVELKQLTVERVEIERAIGQLELDLEYARRDYDDYAESLDHPLEGRRP